MKKIAIYFLLFFSLPGLVIGKEQRIPIQWKECIDGDTAKIILKQQEVKIRFLAVDTPETKHPKKKKEFYGKEASNYTCEKMKNAKKLEIEFDENSDEEDKYHRKLVWLFVNDELFQKKLVQNGYAKVAYLYGDYKYTNILKQEEKKAQEKKLGIWSEKKDNVNDYFLIIIIFLIIIGCMVNTKFRRKTTNKIKRKLKTELKKMVR